MQNKMSFLLLFLLVVLQMSCHSKDNINCAGETNGRFVDKIEVLNDNSKNTVTAYIYNSNKQLDTVKGILNSFQFNTFSYDTQNRVVENSLFTTYNNVLNKARIDSFDYNNKNQVIKKKTYDKNSSKTFALSYSYTFQYDSQNQLEKSIFTYNNDTSRIYNYLWENGNIIKESEYDKKGSLRIEWFYKYDNEKNYYEKLPFNGYNIATRNNIIEVLAKDYTGYLDLIVNPAIYQYCYNGEGYPIKIKTNYGRTTAISYKN